ncbi:glycosyltransferase family 4 protein [Candidatus Woesearchaeota archaeon]|nr:glycosyltransferase family 4 protein [Candidatus Woesearchaeota archaeon]
MKVLMFGWEFPPFKSGGLGTHCYGLTKAMSSKNTQITFVMPKAPGKVHSDVVKLVAANQINAYQVQANGNLKLISTSSSLSSPYLTPEQYQAMLVRHGDLFRNHKNILSMKGGIVLISDEQAASSDSVPHYGWGLYDEVYRYALKASHIAAVEDFDVIHCHDWMTYQAGVKAKQVSGKPLVVTVHSTGFDRTGGHPNQLEYDIERMGMHTADKVIAVSRYTKEMIVKHYGVPADKVVVVYNAVEQNTYNGGNVKLNEKDKIVLYLGRITIQKGPDYFVSAARKVLDIDPNVKFVVAGSGDMLGKMIDQVAWNGMADKFIFAGFVSGPDVDKLYQMADLYVMPSISEPFGITPLEAIKNGTPALISHQSGVSEVLTHALKCDFWDIDEMANKMLAVLKYEELAHTLNVHGNMEVQAMTWDKVADETLGVYSRTIGGY